MTEKAEIFMQIRNLDFNMRYYLNNEIGIGYTIPVVFLLANRIQINVGHNRKHNDQC